MAVTAGALLLCNLHRSAFAVLLPDLCSQLGLRASQVGAVQAAMLAAYLAGQVPSGRLADKYSGTRCAGGWGPHCWCGLGRRAPPYRLTLVAGCCLTEFAL